VATIRASPSDHGGKLCWLEFFFGKKNGSGPDLKTDVWRTLAGVSRREGPDTAIPSAVQSEPSTNSV
jgi:hypothetical protein